MRHQAAIAATIIGLFTLAAIATPTARQQEVAQKGAMVMPFNVHNSTHMFQKNPSGGIQQVIAKNPKDQKLIEAIRDHLLMEAERFGKGDYSDPMKIHGKGMPGVKYLSAVKPGQIAITYRNVPSGAAVDYVGADAATVGAIHKWFDAQLSDHGEDATDQPDDR
jgi:hypothetical protein